MFIKKLINAISRQRDERLTSFDKILLRLSRMRETTEYEILRGEPTTLSLYRITYSLDRERVLEKSVVCDKEAIIALLNSCNVLRWDGFHGKHPKHVRDGTMFSFKATVNEGLTVKADGSENFPKGYRELIRALNSLLKETDA